MEKILQKAWKNYTSNIFSFIGGFLLSLLIPLVVTGIVAIVSFSPIILTLFSSGFSGVVELVKSNMLTHFIIPLVLTAVVLILISAPFYFGFVYMVTTASKRKSNKLYLLFEGVKKFWKRAIVQEFIYLGIIGLVSLPFVKIMFDLLSAVATGNFLSVMFGAGALFVAWFVIILLIAFFLIYWVPVIVIYDKGVIESARISLSKVRKNLLETFVVALILLLISFTVVALENIIPLVPSIVILPLSTCILVEACKELK